jgi:hypothetical protein
MNSINKVLRLLGDEESYVSAEKIEVYAREYLFYSIFLSLFTTPEEKLEAINAVNSVIEEIAISETTLCHHIEKNLLKNNYPIFILNNLDRWYIVVNYLSGRNPELNNYLESRISPLKVKNARLKATEVIKESFRKNYDASSR